MAREKTFVVEPVLMMNATRTTYQNGKKISEVKEEVKANRHHWESWKQADKNMGARVSLRTTMEYKYGVEILSSYTINKPDGTKVVYRTYGQAKDSGYRKKYWI